MGAEFAGAAEAAAARFAAGDAASIALQKELRTLAGADALAAASGKLALLERLLARCRAAGSRALIFSQCVATSPSLVRAVLRRVS